MADLLSFDSLLWNIMLDFVINHPRWYFSGSGFWVNFILFCFVYLLMICFVYHESKRKWRERKERDKKKVRGFLSWLIREKIQRKKMVVTFIFPYLVVKRWKKIIDMYLKWHKYAALRNEVWESIIKIKKYIFGITFFYTEKIYYYYYYYWEK